MTKKIKSYRKFITGAAVAAVVIPAAAPVAFAAELSDIDNHRHKEAIKALVADGIINGFEDGEFKADLEIKRGDAAVMIARAKGLLTGKDIPQTELTDLGSVNERTQEAIAKFVDAEIVSGFADGTFKPNNPIKRGEMAKLVALAYGLPEGDGVTDFSDVNPTQTLAKYVDAIAVAGITEGKGDGTFGYAENIKRGDFAKFVYVAENLEDGEITVGSVAAVTNYVSKTAGIGDEAIQQLELSVNGKSAPTTVAELEEAGYTVKFLSTTLHVNEKGEFSNSGDAKLETGSTFEYKVEISKDGEVVTESALQKVSVADLSAIVEPTKVELVSDGEVWNLDYVTLDNNGGTEKKLNLVITEGKNIAGDIIDKNTDDNEATEEKIASAVSYKSSNNTVALVSNTGAITPLAEGTTTITMTMGEKSTSKVITVKAVPKANSVVENDLRLASNVNTFDVTVLDQYGEKLRKPVTLTAEVKDYNQESSKFNVKSATVNTNSSVYTVTFDGEVSEGTEKVVLKEGNNVVGELSVEVVDVTNGDVDEYKLVSSTNKFELDLNGKTSLDLGIESYVDGVKAKTSEKATDLGSVWEFESVNKDVATVNSDTGVVTAAAEGETTIYLKENDIIRASVKVSVTNSTPQITAITLADEAAEGIVLNEGEEDINALLDQLEITFSDEEATLAATVGEKYTAEEFSQIIDNEGLITVESDTVDGAALTIGTVDADQDGTIVFTVDSEYGSLRVDFNLTVKDVPEEAPAE